MEQLVKITRWFAVSLGSIAFVAMSTGSASAGEVNGNGEEIPATDHAASACAFSGQNDDQTESRVQSYGQIVQAGLKAFVPSPGVACRGNVDFAE